MLKIKDNINLKELEKFGFKPKYDKKDIIKIKWEKVERQCWFIKNNN